VASAAVACLLGLIVWSGCFFSVPAGTLVVSTHLVCSQEVSCGGDLGMLLCESEDAQFGKYNKVRFSPRVRSCLAETAHALSRSFPRLWSVALYVTGRA
jgi:hypothetical protein